MHYSRFGLFLFALLFLLESIIPLRTSAQQLYDGNTNLPPFGSYHGSDFDIVSVQNGNLHIKIPIITVPQRGKPISWSFIFDTPAFQSVWVPQPTPQNPRAGTRSVSLGAVNGWHLSDPFMYKINSPLSQKMCGNV